MRVLLAMPVQLNAFASQKGQDAKESHTAELGELSLWMQDH